MTPATISPSVVIDGVTYTPPGWMHILSIAIAGFEWAERIVIKPDFLTQVNEWFDAEIAKNQTSPPALEAAINDYNTVRKIIEDLYIKPIAVKGLVPK